VPCASWWLACSVVRTRRCCHIVQTGDTGSSLFSPTKVRTGGSPPLVSSEGAGQKGGTKHSLLEVRWVPATHGGVVYDFSITVLYKVVRLEASQPNTKSVVRTVDSDARRSFSRGEGGALGPFAHTAVRSERSEDAEVVTRLSGPRVRWPAAGLTYQASTGRRTALLGACELAASLGGLRHDRALWRKELARCRASARPH